MNDCKPIPLPEEIDPPSALAVINDTINKALAEAGKPLGSVAVTAVSKKHNAAHIETLLRSGHRIFGENRVQEAQAKWPDLQRRYEGVELRLIGPLQTNKVKEAVALFDVIESVDREKLAKALAQEAQKQGGCPKIYIQVNIGEEPQKAGIAPMEAGDFIHLCKEKYALPVEGVMCIPPIGEAPAPYFALLKKIADNNGLSSISMGMSGDYETAVQLGATHVRIGSHIFGRRPS